MAKFLGKILAAAVLGLAAAIFAEIKWKWNWVTTFEWVAGTIAVLLVFGLPLRRWLKDHGEVKARKRRVAEMEAEWQELEEQVKANGGKFPEVDVAPGWLEKDETAYYHAKARMYADENFMSQFLDGDVCDLPGDKFCETASKSNRLWEDYGDVDLIITNLGIRVIADGDIEDISLDIVRSVLPEIGGFVVKGKAIDFEPSFAFEVSNGIVASEILNWVKRMDRAAIRAQERAYEKRNDMTKAQEKFIKKLGGKVKKGMTKKEASDLIGKLLAEKK